MMVSGTPGEREEDEEETRVSLLYSKMIYLDKSFTGLSDRWDPITLKTLRYQFLKLNLALSLI